MNDALILTEIDPAGYAVVTLNRPTALNALSRTLMAAAQRRASMRWRPTPQCACSSSPAPARPSAPGWT